MRKHALTIALAVLLAGCQTAHVSKSLTADLAGADDETQLEFWHTLATQPMTSNDDAFHGVLLYLDSKDDAADYAGRVATLQDRGLLPRGFKEPADQAVSRGTLAVVFSKVLKIRGGVVMAITGPNPRYATRELVFLGIFPQSSPNQTFSGTEFLGIVGKAEDYQRVARAGTVRPLQALQPENEIQGGQDQVTPKEIVEPATSPPPP